MSQHLIKVTPRLANPGGFYPEHYPTLEEKPDPDPTSRRRKKPDPDPTLKKIPIFGLRNLDTQLLCVAYAGRHTLGDRSLFFMHIATLQRVVYSSSEKI